MPGKVEWDSYDSSWQYGPKWRSLHIYISAIMVNRNSWWKAMRRIIYVNDVTLSFTIHLHVYICTYVFWVIIMPIQLVCFEHVEQWTLVLLMEEILHHLGCVKPCKWWITISTGAGYLPSAVFRGTMRYQHFVDSSGSNLNCLRKETAMKDAPPTVLLPKCWTVSQTSSTCFVSEYFSTSH